MILTLNCIEACYIENKIAKHNLLGEVSPIIRDIVWLGTSVPSFMQSFTHNITHNIYNHEPSN